MGASSQCHRKCNLIVGKSAVQSMGLFLREPRSKMTGFISQKNLSNKEQAKRKMLEMREEEKL
jgi:hypothetical protein